MRATGSVVGNFAFAIGAEALFLGGGFGLGVNVGVAQLIDALHKPENAEGHQEEIDDGLDEVAVSQNGGVFAFAQLQAQGRKIDAAGQKGEQGRKQIIDHGIDDGGERRADHHAHGQVDHVSFEGKFFKLFPEFHPDPSLYVKIIA